MAQNDVLFLSHTHSDQPLADAIRDLVHKVFGPDKIKVSYSTNKQIEGGIGAGEDWFEWIQSEIKASGVALILLTPASVQKPWILWEAGAVYGLAMGGADEPRRAAVRPVVYLMDSDLIPSPFRQLQIVKGADGAAIGRLIDEFIGRDYAHLFDSYLGPVEAKNRLIQALPDYERTVKQALLESPAMPTEAAIQEWIERLNNLREKHRESEADHLRGWIDVAFGRKGKEQDRPLDLRIHRILGEMYQSARRHDRAAEQFSLARQLAPRDLFVLRQLGRAHLDNKQPGEAAQIIERMDQLDDKAFEANVECAALKGRWLTEQMRYTEAAQVYQKAWNSNPGSYYLGDLLGQAQIMDNEIPAARKTYERVRQILASERENLWTLATQATADLALGDGDSTKAAETLRKIGRYHPSADNLETIARGLARIRERLNVSNESYERLMEALHGSE